VTSDDTPKDPTTRELRIEQAKREETEEHLIERSGSDNEAHQHERRSEKAGYLKKKLEERERAEREADEN
jgi:hypothetical protein